MELEAIGKITIDLAALARHFPTLRPGTNSAIIDRSIENGMFILPFDSPETADDIERYRRLGARQQRIGRLGEITTG